MTAAEKVLEWMKKYYEVNGTPNYGEIIAQLEMAIEEEKQEQSLPIDSVSDFYYLKNGDEIQKGDEYMDEERYWKWFPTGQIGKKYRSDYHYKHRRKI